MEEEGTRHSPTRCVQLPVPQISIRAGKAPGIRHFDPLWSDQVVSVPTVPGIWARSVTRCGQQGVPLAELAGESLCGLPRWGRIRADPGADGPQTLERFSSRDKTLILFFVDLGGDLLGRSGSTAFEAAGDTACGIAHNRVEGPRGTGSWPPVHERLLSAVRVGSDGCLCPNHPLCGTYCQIAKGPGCGVPRSKTAMNSEETSTPSAGGIT
jgi:hypothetical protein